MRKMLDPLEYSPPSPPPPTVPPLGNSVVEKGGGYELGWGGSSVTTLGWVSIAKSNLVLLAISFSGRACFEGQPFNSKP